MRIKMYIGVLMLILLAGCVPNKYQRDGARIDTQSTLNDVVYPGYTLFSPMGSLNTYLIDTQGETVKQWTSLHRVGSAVYLSHQGTLLRSERKRQKGRSPFIRGGGVGGMISEYDSDNRLIWQFALSDQNHVLHHDFIELKNGNILALSWESVFENGQNYWNERIIEIDKQSRDIIWEWKAMDHIRPDTRKTDFLHFNSIDVSENKILVSVRSKNELWIIDRISGNIEYTYGQGLQGQHDATFLDNGNILVYNNGRQRSSVLELNPETNEIVWKFDNGFFSDHISGAQRLKNGNTLICVGVTGELIEVSQKGQVVWEYKNPYVQTTRNGRQMTSVFNAKKYSLHKTKKIIQR